MFSVIVSRPISSLLKSSHCIYRCREAKFDNYFLLLSENSFIILAEGCINGLLTLSPYYRIMRAQKMDKNDDNLREIGISSHNRLLSGDKHAITEISELFFPLLIKRLKRGFNNLRDPQYIETAVVDVLIKYFRRPQRFDPDKGSLIGYLYKGAYRNVLTHLKQEHRRNEFYRVIPEQELKSVAGNHNPESQLLEKESPLIRKGQELMSDPKDREILELMMQGVRETSEYAKVLGILNLSAVEQAIVVKRHKDRLKATLRRAIKRRLILVAAMLAGLRDRIRAAMPKPKSTVAVVIVLVSLFATGIYFWRRTSDKGNMPESLVSRSEATERPAVAKAARATGPEKIFFSSNRGAARGTAQMHIWMMNPDGTGLEQVTFGDVLDEHPELSPDGKRLGFSRIKSPTEPEGDEVKSIWVMDMIIGTETPITSDTDYPSGPYNSFTPTWSPDGKRIAFIRSTVSSDYPEDKGSYFPGIWVVDFLPAVGTPKPLSSKPHFPRLAPEWSADGSHIFYMNELWLDGPWTIYKINVATGIEEQVIPLAPTELSPIPAGEYSPKISPDGLKIAWTTYRHGMNGGDIYVADAASPVESQSRITPYSGWGAASWSPDGKRLVLTLTRFKLTEKSIESLRAIGFTDEFLAKLKNVNDKEFATESQFLDELRLAIGEEPTARYGYKIQQHAILERGMWITNADGSGLTQLTSGLWKDYPHSWGRLYQPDTDLIETREIGTMYSTTAGAPQDHRECFCESFPPCPLCPPW
jgi:Tol biopolymer transport system component/DNA-directed RNA polymerase specialized sigma24 family protein